MIETSYEGIWLKAGNIPQRAAWKTGTVDSPKLPSHCYHLTMLYVCCTVTLMCPLACTPQRSLHVWAGINSFIGRRSIVISISCIYVYRLSGCVAATRLNQDSKIRFVVKPPLRLFWEKKEYRTYHFIQNIYGKVCLTLTKLGWAKSAQSFIGFFLPYPDWKRREGTQHERVYDSN